MPTPLTLYPSRRALILGLTSAFALPAAPALAELSPAVQDAPKPASAPAPYAGWFKYNQGVERFWRFEAVENDANQLTILPRDSIGLRGGQKILVLYPRPSPAYDVAISKMLSVFEGKNLRPTLTVLNFRLEDPRGQYAIGLAETGSYDLIVAMGSESTAWLWKYYKGGRIPVVSVCSKDPVILGQSPGYDRGSGTNFAFTSLNMPLDVQMAYVMQLRPNLRNLAILVDKQNVSAVETQMKPVADYSRARGIRVLEVVVENPNNAKAELEHLVKDAVSRMQRNDPNLENSLFYITGSTSVFREIAMINANSSRVPVLSMVPEVVTAGDNSATLSIGISFESNAHIAAIYAADILTKRAYVGDLKVGLVSPPDIAINFRKTREIGMKVPFHFFESANNIYDYDGRLVRSDDLLALRK